MSRRPGRKRRLEIERLETKESLSASPLTADLRGLAHQGPAITGVTMDRITNPKNGNAILTPPFQQVLVQSKQPVPGQVYNILFISVWNGTSRTFKASDGLTVKLSNQTPAHAYPVLTGDQEWLPRQRLVFYVLTKKYYPISPIPSAGFLFNIVNPQVSAVPGPSGIFQKIKYNPATFPKVLDNIVAHGRGAYGHELGLPDTAIWELIPPHTAINL